MTSDNENSTFGTKTLGSHVSEDKNIASVNAQDQTLLKALQDLIVRVMDPMQKKDIDQIHLSPEAGKLIIALQEFISSVIAGSQSKARNTKIKVDLVEGNNELRREDDKVPGRDSDLVGYEESSHEDENKLQQHDLVDDGAGVGNESPLEESSLLEIAAPESDSQHLNILEKPSPTFQDKLLRALQEHVFNRMPIRLLCFEPDGETNFQITLLERGTIYARIASVLQGKMHEEEFRPATYKVQLEVEEPYEVWRTETEAEVIQRLISKYAKYAILSHTWLHTKPGEVTYGDWNMGLFTAKDLGYYKLVNFCKVAWKEHGLVFGWMDTICINKESSSELDESIRSMYNWYSRAGVCIVYLAGTATLSQMHLDRWFTRGWTLQELLAPDLIKFYNNHWKRLVNDSNNDKRNSLTLKQIELATTMSTEELDAIHIHASISRRMQLAATREVTREEDTAYSLMGIFDVSISTAYGEGAQRAFSRLLQEILATSEDILDILNWAGAVTESPPYNSHVLPTSPKHYMARSSNEKLKLSRPAEPLTLTHLGLRVPVILMRGIPIRDTTCEHNPIGDYYATTDILPIERYRDDGFLPSSYYLLDTQVSSRDSEEENVWDHVTLAVFNFSASNVISLPRTCIAIVLLCFEAPGQVSNAGFMEVIETDKPTVFELNKRNEAVLAADSDSDANNRWVRPDELVNHGMQMISLYL